MKKLLLVLLFVMGYAQQQIDMSNIDCNSGESCFNKANEAFNQNNIINVINYAAKGCLQFKDSNSCSGLGDIFENLNKFKEARFFYTKACELDNGRGCSNLGFYIYQQGEGVKQNYSKAKQYYEKSCKLNFGGGCYNLGTLYEHGQGVKQNYSKAKQFFGKACNLGYQEGCKAYADLNKQGY